jgi:hypothetical protein
MRGRLADSRVKEKEARHHLGRPNLGDRTTYIPDTARVPRNEHPCDYTGSVASPATRPPDTRYAPAAVAWWLRQSNPAPCPLSEAARPVDVPALRERVEEVEGDTEEAFQARRRLVKLLVQSISAGKRPHDGRTEIKITYRFGPPPTSEVSADQSSVGPLKNGSRS